MVLAGDDPANDDRCMHSNCGKCRKNRWHQFDMAAGENRKPDQVNVFVAGGGCNLIWCATNALVDDLHPTVSGCERDLFGAIRMTVESGFGDQYLGRAVGKTLVEVRQYSKGGCADGGCLSDPSRPLIFAEDTSQRMRPLPRGDASASTFDSGCHDVLGAACHPAQLVDRRFCSGTITTRAPLFDVGNHLFSDLWVHAQDRFGTAERRWLGLGKVVSPNNGDLTSLYRSDPASV